MDNRITSIFLEETDSTNLYLKRMLKEEVKEFTVVSAGEQTAGKGRRGHDWSSPKGTSVSTSMVMFPVFEDPNKRGMLTLLAALAVSRVIEKISGLSCAIKWPNDVLINEKKVSGILTETAPKGSKEAVIVGIGINVHIKEFPEELAEKATSIDLELNKQKRELEIACGDVIDGLWDEFLKLYDDFLMDSSSFLDEYKDRLINTGRIVVAEKNNETIEGECIGVDDTGAILIKHKERIHHINAGDVSVRGIYGYV